MCPNDNASMQTVNRNGVEFDMCPTCRGVWLDRGELEKLIEGARSAFDAPPQTIQPAATPPQQSYSGERGEYGERGDYDQHGRRRRRGGFDLFDIFD
jgi:hypothetical protein